MSSSQIGGLAVCAGAVATASQVVLQWMINKKVVYEVSLISQVVEGLKQAKKK
jgi:hypothetical protein